MAKVEKAHCNCCGFSDVELKDGVCEPCSKGLHQIHCNKPLGEVITTPITEEERAKLEKIHAAVQKEEAEQADPARDEKPPTNGTVTAVVVAEKAAPAARRIDTGRQGLILADLGDMYRFATMVCKANMAPKGFLTPEAVCVAFQFGAEVGLTPMQALQNVYNVGNRPSLFGDAPKALVETSGLMEDFDEWFEHKGERVAGWPQTPEPESGSVCMSKRIGRRPKTTLYTWADAKKAKLTGKDGPWQDNPGRQMMFRARAFNLRDNFPDVLKGFKDEHEMRDTPIDDATESNGEVKMPERASA